MRLKRKKKEQTTVLSRARGMLGEPGNRVRLIVGLLLCILATVAVLYMVSALSLLVSFDVIYTTAPQLALMIEIAFVALQLAALLMLCAPLYLGLYSMALVMRRGAPCTFADLFVFFDSPSEYIRGVGISAFLFGRGYPFLILYLLSFAATVTGELLLSSIVGIAVLPLILLGVYTTGRSYPFLTFALCNPTVPLGRVMVICKGMTRKRLLAIFVFRMRLLWRFVLSLFSVGVITLLHTIPHAVFATHEFSFSLARQHMAELN